MNTGEKRLNRERGKAWEVDLVKTEQLSDQRYQPSEDDLLRSKEE